MNLTLKQRVLFAILGEQQKRITNMNRITPQSLQVEPAQFYVAIEELEAEMLIEGAAIIKDEGWPIPKVVFMEHVQLTDKGKLYVNEVLRKRRLCDNTDHCVEKIGLSSIWAKLSYKNAEGKKLEAHR